MNSKLINLTLTEEEAVILYFKCEWILVCSDIRANQSLARKVLTQITEQNPKIHGLQKLEEVGAAITELTKYKNMVI
jgi:predicted DNA-binding transcriptional regulator YafY